EVGDGDEGASARGARAGRDGATAARGGGAAAGGRGKAGKRDDRVGGVAAATRPSEGGIAAAEEHDRDPRGRPRTAAPGKGRPGPAGGEVAQGPRTGADGGPGGDGTAEAARRLPGARERAVDREGAWVGGGAEVVRGAAGRGAGGGAAERRAAG